MVQESEHKKRKQKQEVKVEATKYFSKMTDQKKSKQNTITCAIYLSKSSNHFKTTG